MNRHLSMARESISRDVQEEGASSYEALSKGRNFQRFYEEHKTEFENFARFIYNHRGDYDRCRDIYVWQTLIPYVVCVFRFGIKMPHRERLLELTKCLDLAVDAADDVDVMRFVVANFDVYTKLDNAFQVLQELDTNILACGSVEKGTPQWAFHVLFQKFYLQKLYM